MANAYKLGIVILATTGLWAGEARADRKSGTDTRVQLLDKTVVGGQPVPEGKWLDTAGIAFGGSQVGCTGVLVAPDVVLTAGHCIGGISSVILGTNDYRSGNAEVINVAQEIEYPNSQSTYDMGVLILERESSIEPRPIVPECMLEADYVTNGAKVTIVGYGALDPDGTQYGTQLMEAFTTITDYNCSSSRACQSGAQPAGELGAGGMGIDSCYGDSGGPLYLNTDRGDFLVGLTSRGYSNTCSEGGIYVRPDALRDWIESTTGRTLPVAGCNKAPLSGSLALSVDAGSTVSALMVVRDEDEGQNHTFSVQTAPQHGEVTVDADGRAHYTASSDYKGDDTFVIAITDDGEPNMTGTITVAVTVNEPPSGCQSGGTGGAGLVLLMGLLAVGLRRRER